MYDESTYQKTRRRVWQGNPTNGKGNPSARFRMCSKKTRYRDEESAKEARRTSLRYRPDEPLYVYNCPVCNGFHLAHVK